MTGKFISLEGPDGSGKSTIMEKIKNYLEDNKIDYLHTREPGGSKIGEDIRKIILDEKNTDMSAQTEALLYAASRSQHVKEKIRPSLEKGDHVFCERFVLSSLAYQGIGRGLGVEEVKKINDFATGNLSPDLILFFDISPEITLERKTKSGGDRLEQAGLDFHQEVYKGYKSLIESYPENIVIIDASKKVEEVYRETIKAIEKVIKKEEE